VTSSIAPLLVGLLTSQLPALEVGDEIPRWRLPVENPSAWGSEHVDLRAFFDGGDRNDEQVVVTFGASWCGPCKLNDEQVVVTFGASWCGPCKLELKALLELRSLLDEMRTQVVVVVADQEPEGRAAMVAWLKADLQVPFAIVADDMGLLARRYRTSELPASFVADRQGRLIWAHAGWSSETTPALLKTLRTGFEERPQGPADETTNALTGRDAQPPG